MTLSIRVDGLDAHGVELLPPTQPAFDEVARPLLGERIADVGLSLKYFDQFLLDGGQSVAESFAPVERFLADATNQMRAGHPRGQSADLWRHEAAADAARWRRRYADADIPSLLKQAIRLEPLT
jgi:hypothetical protein